MHWRTPGRSTRPIGCRKNPQWVQNICTVGNMHVQIGKDAYFLSADGLLMPVKKDQPPPDLRYFKSSSK